ncbi:MAG: GNAT family N-acetyltransferase [Oscillospiraceae bacterium]|nr:GNAT family N-acetyltransferase [Oscillospiraceae bacterium]
MEITVRAAEIDDRRAINRLLLQLDQTEHRLHPERCRRPLAATLRTRWQQRGQVLTALVAAGANGRLLGVLSYSCQEINQSPTRVAAVLLHIHRLAVDAACRRQGVGSALLRRALALAAEYGANRVELSVTESNEPALRLYERWGFSTAEREMLRPAGSLMARTGQDFNQADVHVRRATPADTPALIGLLRQIGQWHHELRPDLFCPGAQKYTPEQLGQRLAKKDWHILVAENAAGKICGHIFCRVGKWRGHPGYKNAGFLFIDDLCVDAQCRGRGIGAALLRQAAALAGRRRFLLLDVTEGNKNALRFYEQHGFLRYRQGMGRAVASAEASPC